VPAARPVLDRLHEKLAEDGECWRFTGAHNNTGYGVITLNGQMTLAHRLMYEAYRAEIPWHLDPVTHRVNLQRGRGCKQDDTTCPRGHEYTDETTLIRADGSRSCRECASEDRKRYYLTHGR
jgi:hypothetical protein